jgi:hypothetical protein
MEQLKECEYLLQIKMEMAKEQLQIKMEIAKEQLQIKMEMAKEQLQYMPCKQEYLLPMAKEVSSDCRGGWRGPVEQLGGTAAWSNVGCVVAWGNSEARQHGARRCGEVESGVSAARVLSKAAASC